MLEIAEAHLTEKMADASLAQLGNLLGNIVARCQSGCRSSAHNGCPPRPHRRGSVQGFSRAGSTRKSDGFNAWRACIMCWRVRVRAATSSSSAAARLSPTYTQRQIAACCNRSHLRRAVEAAGAEALRVLAKPAANLRNRQAHGQDRHTLLAADGGTRRSRRRCARSADAAAAPALGAARAGAGVKYLPLWSSGVAVQARVITSSASGHALARVIASEAVADELVLVEDRCRGRRRCRAGRRARLSSRDSWRRQPHRMAQRHLDDGKADADVLRAHRQRGGKRDRVRIDALAGEVVLGEPDAVEAELLGERRLLELLENGSVASCSGAAEWASVIQPNLMPFAPATCTGRAESIGLPVVAARDFRAESCPRSRDRKMPRRCSSGTTRSTKSSSPSGK